MVFASQCFVASLQDSLCAKSCAPDVARSWPQPLEVIFLGSFGTTLVHVCPSCVGGRPPHSQGRVSGRFSGINVKAYLVSYDLNIMSLVLMLRLSGFLSQKWFFSDKPPAEA